MVVVTINPSQMEQTPMIPGTVSLQFYVVDNKLSCMVNQHFCDVGITLPFLISAYSFVTIIIANQTGLEPHELVISMGEYCMYSSQSEKLRKQLTHKPHPFPTLHVINSKDNIDDYTDDDFKLVGYDEYYRRLFLYAF